MMNDESQGARAGDDAGRLRFRSSSPVGDYLQLMRLPNLFTAVADVTMGFVVAQPLSAQAGLGPWQWASLGTLAAASVLLYAGGVVLNDWFDLEIDRRERPERPLPSGRIAASTARRLGWTLLWLGVGVASGAVCLVGHFRPGAAAAMLAAAVVVYDAWLKRTPLGPLAMGTCRMLNVMLGMSAADAPLRAGEWLVAGGIGVYVAGITWFARNESRRSARGRLAAATAVMVLGIAMIAWFPRWPGHVLPVVRRQPALWYSLAAVLGLWILRRCLGALLDPSPKSVQRAVSFGVLYIVTLDSLACYAVGGPYWAILVLLLLAPAMVLGRRIRAT
jgi:4-hydroxybenzoate polyprenyltransferase